MPKRLRQFFRSYLHHSPAISWQNHLFWRLKRHKKIKWKRPGIGPLYKSFNYPIKAVPNQFDSTYIPTTQGLPNFKWNLADCIANIVVKNGPSQASFSFIFVLPNKHNNFNNQYMWRMSIQYMVLGFEPMPLRTWVFDHKHSTRAPARLLMLLFRSCLLRM